MGSIKKYVLAFGMVAIAYVTWVSAADPNTFNNHMNKSRANKDGPDHVQHEAAGPGWFSNLGPTGIRAMLTDAEGKVEWKGQGIQYLVKYVFPGSPADGKVKPGDIIIAESRAMQEVMQAVTAFSPYDEPILLTGETGTGKEVIARLRKHLPTHHEPGSPSNPHNALKKSKGQMRAERKQGKSE